MTADQLLRLATTYARLHGLTLRRVGILSAGSPTLFHRLSAGKGAHCGTIERASRWLSRHWPRGILWPGDIPDEMANRPGGSTVDHRSTGGEARAGGLTHAEPPGRDCGP
jgi:hypothetical protein